MADDDDRNDTTVSQNFNYDSNIRFTDDPAPEDVPKQQPPDYPTKDSDVDTHQAYDEGEDEASNTPPYGGQAG
jgi:hypothetical protein